MTGEARADGDPAGRWRRAAGRAAVLVLLAACATPPPMAPLTARRLEAAERRWRARGAESYRLVVRVRAPRAEAAVYDVLVSGDTVVETARGGAPSDGAAHDDYSMAGLFELLRRDLRLTEVRAIGDTPPVDLRARFERRTGRLVRYRRTVGSARRAVLLVEVLAYEDLGRVHPDVRRAAR
ncbi:MAG TPA: hypothetical protein VFD84_10380 [Candidatus Binatia bacterium]|nr:hypothetical protein [Candidatus Binatia bacterium]